MASPSAASRLRWSRVEDDAALPGMAERVSHPGFEGIEFLHVRAKSLINHVPAAAGMPFEWTINVYRGCTHACSYCFARPSHTWLDLDAGDDFDRVIVVKVNAVARLRAELRSSRWQGQHIALGTNTDPYQRCEGRYRLTRGVVETLTAARNPYSVLTKGTLALRDLDLFGEAQEHTGTSVNYSIGTLDETVWRITEPGTAAPARRMEAVAALADAGIPSGVMVAPIIPGLSDSRAQLREVVTAALEAGASFITPIVLHLRPGVREVFLTRLADHDAELADHLRERYERAYLPTDDQRRITGMVRDLVRRAGGVRPPPAGPTRRDAPTPRDVSESAPSATQLALTW